MGADIHLYSETQRTGVWEADQAASYLLEREDDRDYPSMNEAEGSERDYWYFGLLAGVRTEWPFEFARRGLPSPMSEQVEAIAQSWDGDGHSHNWITRAELIAKREELNQLQVEVLINPNPEYQANHLEHLVRRLDDQIAYLRSVSPDVPDDDQRLVFWFDN